jgi:hypothetical protein
LGFGLTGFEFPLSSFHFRLSGFPNPESRIPSPGDEALHSKRVGPVRIHQLGPADIFLPDYASDAGEHQLQFFRIRRERKKQSALSDAWFHGVGSYRDL